jgi:hypothetical protein
MKRFTKPGAAICFTVILLACSFVCPLDAAMLSAASSEHCHSAPARDSSPGNDHRCCVAAVQPVKQVIVESSFHFVRAEISVTSLWRATPRSFSNPLQASLTVSPPAQSILRI